MSFAELLLVAVGLSMDAFAVAVCRGLEMRKIDYRQALLIAVFFGGFQALMPVVGYLLGAALSATSAISTTGSPFFSSPSSAAR